MRQRMEMFTLIAEAPGLRRTIQNIIHLLQPNRLLQKVAAPALIPSPADPRLPAKCPALPATGPGAVPAQADGVEAAEVLAGVVEEEVAADLVAETEADGVGDSQ